MTPRLRGKSRAERTEDLRLSILDASLELFLEQGYEKTTTRQVLQEVGILNGSLYNIYKSKEDIFADLIMMAFEDVSKEVSLHLPEGADPCTRLTVLLGTFLNLSSRSPRIAELLVISHGRWEIHSKIVTAISEWMSDVDGELDNDIIDLTMKLDACTSVTGTFLEKMYREPDAFDLRSAIAIVASVVAAVMDHEDDFDIELLIERLDGMEFEICGIRL